MILLAEYVSPGHPDRLCDNIVNSVVNYVIKKDKDALCSLECAIYKNKVFLDGRIFAGKDKEVICSSKIKEIIKKVYKDVGYGENDWHPYPDELDIIVNVDIDTLSDEKRYLRQYSADQNVVTGYALNSPETDYLPIAHYVVNKLGERLVQHFSHSIDNGPDFKILAQIEKDNDTYRWRRLTISCQHKSNYDYESLYSELRLELCLILRDFQRTKLYVLSSIDSNCLYLNGAGDFIQGGPNGDNGLSGKKLCLDFYGPSVPIGGGAIYGKDIHKIDVCGTFKARDLAVKLVKENHFYSVFTTLSWSPGEKTPYIIEAYEIDEFGTKIRISDDLLPPKDTFSIECINNDLHLEDRTIMSVRDIK